MIDVIVIRCWVMGSDLSGHSNNNENQRQINLITLNCWQLQIRELSKLHNFSSEWDHFIYKTASSATSVHQNFSVKCFLLRLTVKEISLGSNHLCFTVLLICHQGYTTEISQHGLTYRECSMNFGSRGDWLLRYEIHSKMNIKLAFFGNTLVKLEMRSKPLTSLKLHHFALSLNARFQSHWDFYMVPSIKGG